MNRSETLLHELFIYGTLRRGEPYHDLLGAAAFLGKATTELGFELVHFGAYPAMTRSGQSYVVGEVFAVSDKVLPTLDAYEDHPVLYERQSIRLADGRVVLAYVMEHQKTLGLQRIPSGDWTQR